MELHLQSIILPKNSLEKKEKVGLNLSNDILDGDLMKKWLLLLIIAIVLTISLIVLEFYYQNNATAMINVIRKILGISFLFLSICILLLYSFFQKDKIPDFINVNSFEIIITTIVMFIVSLVLIFKK